MSQPKQGSWCYGCHADEQEPAAEGCKNPGWHVPNANRKNPKAADEQAATRLPYVEDRD